MAARPATAIELLTVLAAPLNLAMGEPVALGGTTLEYGLDAKDLCRGTRDDLRSG